MNRFVKQILILLCFLCLIGNTPIAQAAPYSHISSGVCADFLSDLPLAKQKEFARMHDEHLAQMRPLYREYEKVEHALYPSKYYGYGTKELKKADMKKLKTQKKEIEKEINEREHAFAKAVQERFGKKLKVSRRHTIRHGKGIGSVCGYVGDL